MNVEPLDHSLDAGRAKMTIIGKKSLSASIVADSPDCSCVSPKPRDVL